MFRETTLLIKIQELTDNDPEKQRLIRIISNQNFEDAQPKIQELHNIDPMLAFTMNIWLCLELEEDELYKKEEHHVAV